MNNILRFLRGYEAFSLFKQYFVFYIHFFSLLPSLLFYPFCLSYNLLCSKLHNSFFRSQNASSQGTKIVNDRSIPRWSYWKPLKCILQLKYYAFWLEFSIFVIPAAKQKPNETKNFQSLEFKRLRWTRAKQIPRKLGKTKGDLWAFPK